MVRIITVVSIGLQLMFTGFHDIVANHSQKWLLVNKKVVFFNHSFSVAFYSKEKTKACLQTFLVKLEMILSKPKPCTILNCKTNGRRLMNRNVCCERFVVE